MRLWLAFAQRGNLPPCLMCAIRDRRVGEVYEIFEDDDILVMLPRYMFGVGQLMVMRKNPRHIVLKYRRAIVDAVQSICASLRADCGGCKAAALLCRINGQQRRRDHTIFRAPTYSHHSTLFTRRQTLCNFWLAGRNLCCRANF